jgi:DNA-binding NarL/FixJ family response regulator
MMQAIRQVLIGRIYLISKSSAQIIENVAGKRAKASPIKRLSDREFEVFQLIGRANSTAQIAEGLYLMTKTVESHRARLREKLDFRTMPERNEAIDRRDAEVPFSRLFAHGLSRIGSPQST